MKKKKMDGPPSISMWTVDDVINGHRTTADFEIDHPIQ